MPHDLPADREPAFYEELKQGALKHYSTMGANDRNQIYFLRMYLACYRAVDYLTTRPDWNHKAILVRGGSQGGLQAIMTAALHPAVTMATAHLPAGCDHTGPLIGRAPGWPNLLGTSQGAEREARVKASRYYDMVNFAARVHCPILVGVGLIDTTCPPAGVCAMFNRINAPKRIVIMPGISHHAGQRNQSAYFSVCSQWWNAAKDDQSPPLQ
jgi:cephalosporin-C deacetylase-like acetyl esterase